MRAYSGSNIPLHDYFACTIGLGARQRVSARSTCKLFLQMTRQWGCIQQKCLCSDDPSNFLQSKAPRYVGATYMNGSSTLITWCVIQFDRNQGGVMASGRIHPKTTKRHLINTPLSDSKMWESTPVEHCRQVFSVHIFFEEYHSGKRAACKSGISHSKFRSRHGTDTSHD